MPLTLTRRHFSQHLWQGLVTLLLLLLSPAPSANEQTYLQELIQLSRQQALAQHPQWLRLLHYQPRTLFKGVISEVDDPNFFTHPKGKQDPQAELEATLEAFFSPTAWGKKTEPAQCAFIARYEWLKLELGFDINKLPPLNCDEFARWYAGINPGSLTLVFPSAYLNNPSSMFGHTLLRVDPPGKGQETPLLSYVINYGAETGNDGGIAFAIKGIFGGYPGYVGIGPYYKKVKEYSDVESRDIWEYQLNLKPDELRRLMTHVWELRGVYFDYYFFDENCSYLVLGLLDVARPSLGLSQQFSGWVIPSDTLRQVTRQKGLVQKIVYRPAAETKLLYGAGRLSEAGQKAAKALAEQDLALPAFLQDETFDEEKGDILLLAHDYLHYEFQAHRQDRDTASRLSREILIARSKMNAAPPPPPPTPKVSPEQGHATAMLQGGLGREHGQSLFQLSVRPAYHDLLDKDAGYIPGAQIDFLNLRLQYENEREKLLLDKFILLDIISLTPQSRFTHPISWHVSTGWERRLLPANPSPDHVGYFLEAGGGLSFKPVSKLLFYGFLDAAISGEPELHKNYAAGLGLQAGLLAQVTADWKIRLNAQEVNYRAGDPHRYARYSLGQRINLNKQHALDMEWQRQQVFDLTSNRYSLSWRWYW